VSDVFGRELPAPAKLEKPSGPIKVGGKEIRFRLLQTRLFVLVVGLMGVCFVSGLYYGIFEVHWWIPFTHVSLFYNKPWWDHEIWKVAWWTDGAWRHGERDLNEGLVCLLLGLKALSVKWENHYDETTGVLTVAWRFIASLILGEALILAALWISTFGVLMARHKSFSVHYAEFSASYLQYVYITAGLAIGLVVNLLVWKPAGRTIQRWLAEFSAGWWYRTGRMPIWIRFALTTPELRERTVYLFIAGVVEQARGLWIRWVFPWFVLFFLAVMGWGIYARWFA
jgi:hypothetical protein